MEERDRGIRENFSPVEKKDSSRKIITDVYRLRDIIAEYKKAGKTVVFSSGHFDIVHSDHVKWLERLKSLGDILVIDIATDKTVKMFKGKRKPINSEIERALVIAGFESVDHVVINHSEHIGATNLAILTKPTIFVQKAESREEKYSSEDGLNHVRALLGETELVFLPGVRTPGISTSETIVRVVKAYSPR